MTTNNETCKKSIPEEFANLAAHAVLLTGGIFACCRITCEEPGCLILPHPGRQIDKLNTRGVFFFPKRNVILYLNALNRMEKLLHTRGLRKD